MNRRREEAIKKSQKEQRIKNKIKDNDYIFTDIENQYLQGYDPKVSVKTKKSYVGYEITKEYLQFKKYTVSDIKGIKCSKVDQGIFIESIYKKPNKLSPKVVDEFKNKIKNYKCFCGILIVYHQYIRRGYKLEKNYIVLENCHINDDRIDIAVKELLPIMKELYIDNEINTYTPNKVYLDQELLKDPILISRINNKIKFYNEHNNTNTNIKYYDMPKVIKDEEKYKKTINIINKDNEYTMEMEKLKFIFDEKIEETNTQLNIIKKREHSDTEINEIVSQKFQLEDEFMYNSDQIKKKYNILDNNNSSV